MKIYTVPGSGGYNFQNTDKVLVVDSSETCGNAGHAATITPGTGSVPTWGANFLNQGVVTRPGTVFAMWGLCGGGGAGRYFFLAVARRRCALAASPLIGSFGRCAFSPAFWRTVV